MSCMAFFKKGIHLQQLPAGNLFRARFSFAEKLHHFSSWRLFPWFEPHCWCGSTHTHSFSETIIPRQANLKRALAAFVPWRRASRLRNPIRKLHHNHQQKELQNREMQCRSLYQLSRPREIQGDEETLKIERKN